MGPLEVEARLDRLVRSPSKSYMIDYVINLLGILGALMVGTGSLDIAKVITTMGIGSGASFERQFYRMCQYVHERILGRCRTIITDSLNEDILLTYDDLLKDKLDKNKIKTLKSNIRNGNLPSINSEIPACPLAVSYDMGCMLEAGYTIV